MMKPPDAARQRALSVYAPSIHLLSHLHNFDVGSLRIYKMAVAITFDPPKRDWTLRVRGLDFEDAAQVFAGPTLSAPDDREDYGELRIITVGLLDGRMVIVGWTPRGADRHVFTMMKCNDREQARYRKRLG